MPIRDLFRTVAEEQKVEADVETFMKAKLRIAPECPHQVTLIRPVEAIYRKYHQKIPMAIASSGLRVNVERHLKECGVFGT